MSNGCPPETKSTRDYCPGDDEEVAEDQELQEDEEMGHDDSEIPTREVVEHVVTKKTRRNRKVKAAKGDAAVGLGSCGDAEDVDAEIVVADEGELATGKRKRRPNQNYVNFWRHARTAARNQLEGHRTNVQAHHIALKVQTKLPHHFREAAQIN
ncbi:hypothetical protein B0H13DRAFT_1890313 [Mycena leptocephala]|nr:hypothetical protein B0H13DRAFT_1890313 [Mycena leptocephala]